MYNNFTKIKRDDITNNAEITMMYCELVTVGSEQNRRYVLGNGIIH